MKQPNIIQRFCLFLLVLVLAAPAWATDYNRYGYETFRSRETVEKIGKNKLILQTLEQGHVKIWFGSCKTTSGTGNSAIYEVGRGTDINIETDDGYAIRWIILRDTEGGEDYDHPRGLERISEVTSGYDYYFEKNAITNSRISGGNKNNLNDDDNNIVVYNYDAPAKKVKIWSHYYDKWDQFKVRDIIVGYVKIPNVRYEKEQYDIYSTLESFFDPNLKREGHVGHIEWELSNPNIVDISGIGCLRPKHLGKASLTATFSAYWECGKVQCKTIVNVIRDRVNFTAKDLPGVLFDTYDLHALIDKKTQSGQGFKWNNPGFSVTSSNSSVLRYDNGKLLLGGTAGEATITLKQEQNDLYEATTFSHTFIVMRRDQNGTILIKDANEWKLFCKLVNEKGMTRLNARLEADIDLGNNSMMVGTNNHKYAGTFDGAGHTLTVHVVGAGQGTAPFHRTDDATIKNLTIAGTVTAPANTDNYHTAGLVGFAESTTLRSCVVKADIHLGKTGDQYSGGLIGHILSGNTTIEDCAFIGSITGDNGNVSNIAGLIAWGDAGTTTISNSYVNATYTKVSGLNPILRRQKGTTNNLNHVYYSEKSKGINPDYNKKGNLGEQVTAEQLRNGEVAYLLQNKRTENVWGQNLGSDDEPLLTADGAKRVYKVDFTFNSQVRATRYATRNKAIYGSMPTVQEILGTGYNPQHYYSGLTFADNFSGSTSVTADKQVAVSFTHKVVCEIASKADWKEFRDLVNGGQTKLNAKMTADVDLGSDIVMVGVTRNYSGTFDGQGHALTVNWNHTSFVNIAPFKTVEGATIKNLHVKGQIEATGNSLLSGLILSASGKISVSGCVIDVDLKGSSYLAGMIHMVNLNTEVIITDCVVKGALNSAKKSIGGFVDYQGGTCTLTNCLYIGKNNATTGSNTFADNATLNNCYYLNTCGKAQGKQVTAERLKSGEMAKLLQGDRTENVWGQTLGTDLEPLPTTDEAKHIYKVAFTYNNEATAARYANKGGTVSLPTLQEALGNSYNPHHYYTGLAFADGFSETTTIDDDKTVAVNVNDKECFDIASKEDWKAFRELVNDGQTGVDARLMQDVDLGEEILMLGYYLPNVYEGTFDGQGHTLSFNWTTPDDEKAPFKNVKDATIRNLHIKGSITLTEKNPGDPQSCGSQAAGLINYAYGNTTVSGCVIDVNLKVGRDLAGILLTPDDTAHITINDCVVKGYFHATDTLEGGTHKIISGFIGHKHKDAACTLNNCLYLGTNNASPKPSTTGFSSFTFCPEQQQNEGTGFMHINNCYYLNPSGKVQGDQITEAQLKNGEVAKLLQADRTDQCYWAQALGEEPSPYREADKAKPNYVYYNKENNGWACDDFRLTDDKPLPIGIDFTAAKVSYERDLSIGKATLCLPYELSVQGFKAYTISGGNNSAVHFADAKDKLEAYKPYLITADGVPQLGGNDIQVKAYKADALTTTAGKYSFVGTVTGVDNATAAAANAYILQNDGLFHKVTTEHPGATVPAYRAYVTCPKGAGAKQLSIVIDGETTGIGGATNDARGRADGPVYDLQGRRVADRLDDAARHRLPAGVYIVGGRKVVVK
ncbi:peptidase M26 [Prevotella sp. oral taxon 820]|uniref:peptidase M26 n=1 Tax=Prevotella sp. oral taxon 820 TaxID=2081962 RepID=UPI000D1ED1E8|nr:peptidase M26 [Prevotella sp. oral taxon 820]PTL26855.1 peptidase M26 [Prevotella sp. oral taxon 820]